MLGRTRQQQGSLGPNPITPIYMKGPLQGPNMGPRTITRGPWRGPRPSRPCRGFAKKKKMEHFGNSFCVEKEFPNVIRKLINPPQAKTISREIRSLRQVFSTKRENGHSDRKISCLVIKKKWKDKVSCFPPKKKRVSDRNLGK